MFSKAAKRSSVPSPHHPLPCPLLTILFRALSSPSFISDTEEEKASLKERSSRADAEVLAKRCQVNNLSTRLSSLARLHKTLVGNHSHTLATLETLRVQLKELGSYRGVK